MVQFGFLICFTWLCILSIHLFLLCVILSLSSSFLEFIALLNPLLAWGTCRAYAYAVCFMSCEYYIYFFPFTWYTFLLSFFQILFFLVTHYVYICTMPFLLSVLCHPFQLLWYQFAFISLSTSLRSTFL